MEEEFFLGGLKKMKHKCCKCKWHRESRDMIRVQRSKGLPQWKCVDCENRMKPRYKEMRRNTRPSRANVLTRLGSTTQLRQKAS